MLISLEEKKKNSMSGGFYNCHIKSQCYEGSIQCSVASKRLDHGTKMKKYIYIAAKAHGNARKNLKCLN